MPRSLKKAPYVQRSLLKKVEQLKSSKRRQGRGRNPMIKTWSRASTIIPPMVQRVIHVHTGRRFIGVFVTDHMVGHKLGEFVRTRHFRRFARKNRRFRR